MINGQIVSKDFRPHFYANSFNPTKQKISRNQIFFDYLVSKNAPISVKRIINLIQTQSVHSHYGLYKTHGCLLLSTLSDLFLKDEKTVKSYIEETIEFVSNNPITISVKCKNSDHMDSASYSLFEKIEIVKTERGKALVYSLNSALSQIFKPELNKTHFFKIYKNECVKKNQWIDLNDSDSKVCEYNLFQIIDVRNLVPTHLVNLIFDLKPYEILNLEKTIDNLNLAEDDKALLKNALLLKNNNLNEHFIVMPSWVDAYLSKSSESNLYYYCVQKYTNNLKNHFRKSKFECVFEIRISSLKKLLNRTSKNYDNNSIKKYLQEVMTSINTHTDINIDLFKINNIGKSLSFKFLVRKKSKHEIETIHDKFSNCTRTVKASMVDFKYEKTISRKTVLNEQLTIDQNGQLVAIDYVLFDDLIKNPKQIAQTDINIVSEQKIEIRHADSKVNQPKAHDKKDNSSETQHPRLSLNELNKIKSGIKTNYEFNKELDALVLNLTNSVDHPYSFKNKVYLTDSKTNQIILDITTRSDGDKIIIPRSVIFENYLKNKNSILNVSISLGPIQLPLKRFSYSDYFNLLSESYSIKLSNNKEIYRNISDRVDLILNVPNRLMNKSTISILTKIQDPNFQIYDRKESKSLFKLNSFEYDSAINCHVSQVDLYTLLNIFHTTCINNMIGDMDVLIEGEGECIAIPFHKFFTEILSKKEDSFSTENGQIYN